MKQISGQNASLELITAQMQNVLELGQFFQEQRHLFLPQYLRIARSGRRNCRVFPLQTVQSAVSVL